LGKEEKVSLDKKREGGESRGEKGKREGGSIPYYALLFPREEGARAMPYKGGTGGKRSITINLGRERGTGKKRKREMGFGSSGRERRSGPTEKDHLHEKKGICCSISPEETKKRKLLGKGRKN